MWNRDGSRNYMYNFNTKSSVKNITELFSNLDEEK